MAKKTHKIYGINSVTEALDAGRDFDKVMLRRDMGGKAIKQLVERLEKESVPIQKVPDVRLKKETGGGDQHQGIVAFVSPIKYFRIEDVLMQLYERGETPFFVLPAGVTDMRNLGGIARSAEGMGAQAIILSADGRTRVNADALNTSAGALQHISVVRVPEMVLAIEYLKQSGVRVIACDERGETRLWDAELSGPICLVIGAEGEGIPQKVRAACGESINIPMAGEINSLNVSVASGMALYEIHRQRFSVAQ